MADELRKEGSRGRFLTQFEILIGSGIGVLLVHAREPHRVCDALHSFADAKTRPYKEWNARDGWIEWPISKGGEVALPKKLGGTPEFYKDIARIQDLQNGGAEAWREGIFAMIYPHWWLGKIPAAIQCLKIYAQEFSRSKQRLVLIVPEGYSLPKELENDVPILDLELPTREELNERYERVIDSSVAALQAKSKKQVARPYSSDQIEAIVSIGAGMTEMEFTAAVSRAAISNKLTFPKTPLHDFTRVISDAKVEVVKRSEVLELMQPVPIDEVGGLDLYKSWVIERKACFTPEFAEFCGGKDTPKGALLVGPPGTGKTLLGKATASVLGYPFIRMDISRVFTKMVGDSEERVRSALKLLEAMAPNVAMIDEIDKAGLDPRQGGGDSGTSKRIMGSILTFLQESKAPIFWLFTANRVDSLPPELARRGRLDEIWSVQAPNETERSEIINIHLHARNQDPDTIADLDVAVKASDRFVSAEIEGAIKDAVIESFHSGNPVTGQMIKAKLGGMKPISEAFPEDFEAMRKWASNNARPASTDTSVRSRVRVAQPADLNGNRDLEMT